MRGLWRLGRAVASLRRGPWRLVLGSATIATISGLLATGGPVAGEQGATEVLTDLPGPVIDVLSLVMQLGTRPAILLVAAVAVVVSGRDWKRVAAAVVISGAVAWGVAEVAKDTVERPRPAAYSTEITVHDDASGSGWPSTHTAVAAGSLTAAALIARRNATAAVVVASVVGLARMAVGVHFPLDVVGGLGLGVAAAVSVVWLVYR